jgi:hypothetical protein
MSWKRLSPMLAPLLIALLVGGCGDGTSSNESPEECPLGQERNRVSGECDPREDDLWDAGDSDSGSSVGDAGVDVGNDATGSSDSGPDDSGPDDSGTSDGGPDDDVDPTCADLDADGFADEACGGQDCDDTNPAFAPGMAEVCDAHDNDCDGQINQGIQCKFYAHSYTDMYLVDPFAKTATQVTTVPSLYDMDTHSDGTLYGITSSSLYKYDQGLDQWDLIGALSVSGTPNGLAIDSQGTAFVTAGNTVYTVDLQTGVTTTVGSMGGSYNSSGDCVVNKDDSLYMSSNHGFSGDSLVFIDGTTAQANEVGAIGESSVYGLTAAWGRMFGLTGDGKLIEINSGTGQSTVLHTFPSISWYGAASTPQR